MVYSRQIGDKEYTFGVSGMLLKNALIMFDHQTKSLWPVMMNRAIKGEMTGTALEEIPGARKMTWKEWREAHPDTRVLSVEGKEYNPKNVYGERLAKGKAAVRPIENKDDRLKDLVRVIGVVVGEEFRAYPLEKIGKGKAIQEEVAGVPIVVAVGEKDPVVGVFDRRLGQEVLQFARVSGTHLIDDGGTRWNMISGLAVEGPRKGKELTFVPAKAVYWYIWADYHPETGIYEGAP